MFEGGFDDERTHGDLHPLPGDHDLGVSGGRARSGRVGFPGAPGPHGPGPSMVLERLLFPCRSACLDAAHTCSDAADDAAVTCIEAACGDTLDAARTACAVDGSRTIAGPPRAR